VADSSILLFAHPSTGGLALRDRLISLGFRCRLASTPGGEEPDPTERAGLLVVAAPADRSLGSGDMPPRPAGSPLAAVPLVVLGGRSIEPGVEADEVLPEDCDDSHLAARLRVWARWGDIGIRLRELETAGIAGQSLDPLTGLPGYAAFTVQLDAEVKRFERYETAVGLVLADVQGLRSVNERYGHATGDLVLRQVGEMLRRAVRQVDVVTRYAGDTFAVLLPQADGASTARAATRLRSLVTNLIIRGEAPEGATSPLLKVSVHIGHASLPDEKIRGRGGLLAAAEAALDRERRAQASPTTSA